MKYLSIFLSFLATLAFAAPAAEGKPEADDTVTQRVLVETVFPHYLVPLKQAQPNTAFGTQFTGTVQYNGHWTNDEITTIVGFDMPNNRATTCQIKFRLPTQSSNSWTLVASNPALLEVYALSRIVNHETDTWNTRPARSPERPIAWIRVISGGDGEVMYGAIPCNKGQRLDFELVAIRSGSMYLNWFELDTPKTGITIEMY